MQKIKLIEILLRIHCPDSSRNRKFCKREENFCKREGRKQTFRSVILGTMSGKKK